MRTRFKEKYKVSEKYAKVLTNDKGVALFFEEAATKVDSQLAATWVCEEVLAQLNYRNKALSETELGIGNFVELMELVSSKKITEVVAKRLLEQIIDSGESPKKIVQKEGLGAVKDEGQLTKAVKDVIYENPGPVADYKAGKKESINFLMGKVMQKMRGRADARTVANLLNNELR
jgi:aspartyl-tRNA(Asn)/glutamyl-tRNA(Gln) amidotransferase subunit B